jgi:hypothetical protein
MRLSAKVVGRAEGQGVCKAGAGTSGDLRQGRFLWIGPLYGYLGCFLILWKKHAISPIWFQTGPDWKENTPLPPETRKQLKSILSLACIDPSRFPLEDNKELFIPLLLKPGVEEDQLVSGLTEQIIQLRKVLFDALPKSVSTAAVDKT